MSVHQITFVEVSAARVISVSPTSAELRCFWRNCVYKAHPPDIAAVLGELRTMPPKTVFLEKTARQVRNSNQCGSNNKAASGRRFQFRFFDDRPVHFRDFFLNGSSSPQISQSVKIKSEELYSGQKSLCKRNGCDKCSKDNDRSRSPI